MQLRQKTLTAVLITGACLLSGGLAISQDAAKQVPESRHARSGEPIAGIPQEEALQIYHRHVKELQNLPGVVSVSFTADGLAVVVRDPSILPPAVEGLPVFSVPPTDPWAVRTIDGSTPVPPRPVTEEPSIPPSNTPVEPKPRPSLDCGTEAHWDPQVGRCRRNVPLTTPQRKFLPPSAGVVVLKPNGVREHADICPPSFKEILEQEWRFCIDPIHPETIPPLWEPPIAGIPYSVTHFPLL